MKGAREFAKLFKTGQYGKLYITSGDHARGETFHIQILPEGETAKPNGGQNLCLNSDAIEVYGIVAGQPGWTESYGWLHEGEWQDDFRKLVTSKQMELADKETQNQVTAEEVAKEKRAMEKKLLDAYSCDGKNKTHIKAD